MAGSVTESGRGRHRDTQNRHAGDRVKVEPGGEAAVSRGSCEQGSWAEPRAPGVEADWETMGCYWSCSQATISWTPRAACLRGQDKGI